MDSKIINAITCSAAMSVNFVSSIFLCNIIGIKDDKALLPYCLLVSIIYTAMLLSENKKLVLLKWVLSLPFSLLCFYYFFETKYSVRALNWAVKGYGRQSAGGNFAGFIALVIQLILCLTGIIIANIKSTDKIQKYTNKQTIASLVIGFIIMFIVIYLETQFPNNNYIMS